ncbi:hypothetical protein [Agrobacterium tumefaciens]|uniref:hypothetical protein n=1 Tax=Agrobacterium tumefaciens TaxID=358 RepID=UPI001573312A|nr:hypothetical protein [Agrobacterium tumefaciens]WCK69406.1 hypothetical protein G6L23_027430 [Agrobacterium tumefaciens]
MKNKVQLIAYVDRLSGGGFPNLKTLIESKFAGLFGGLYALPAFTSIDFSNAGFHPIDHTTVDPRLGRWRDVRRFGRPDLEHSTSLPIGNCRTNNDDKDNGND